MVARPGLDREGVESSLVRRALLIVPVLASVLLAVPARGSEPASGSIDRKHPTVTWSGTIPAQLAGVVSGFGCQTAVPDPTCDTFALTVGALQKKRNDVLVAIATPHIQPGEIVELDLYVYGPDGTEIGRGTDLGSNDTVTIRDAAPGTYTVAVQAVLSSDPSEVYEGSATALDAGAEQPVDAESGCGLESVPEVREPAREVLGSGNVDVVGDPFVAADGLDTGDPIGLDVLVILDGITQAEAEAIFARAAEESYAPLNIQLRATEYRTHAFLDRNGAPETDGLAIIRGAKALLGGARPAGVDIVEVLVGRDIQQLNQSAIAGIADCIGGVAHPDRAFLVAEGRTPTNYGFGPVVFGYDANPHVTAHEIGHLMGGQHHYANCVEGIDATDVHEDHVEGSPCTLMFNAADFLGGDFDTVNGAIVRGSAHRYARP
jgi:hypothetical protein